MKKTKVKPENKDKVKLWVEKLKELEEVELPKALVSVGQSGTGMDMHENGEFEDAELQVKVIQARIDNIKKLIRSLKREK